MTGGGSSVFVLLIIVVFPCLSLARRGGFAAPDADELAEMPAPPCSDQTNCYAIAGALGVLLAAVSVVLASEIYENMRGLDAFNEEQVEQYVVKRLAEHGVKIQRRPVTSKAKTVKKRVRDKESTLDAVGTKEGSGGPVVGPALNAKTRSSGETFLEGMLPPTLPSKE